MGTTGVLDLLLRRRVEAARESQERVQNLETKLASLPMIEQAKGIVMGNLYCSADEAFEILRLVSMERNQKLRDIAAELVDATTAKPGGGTTWVRRNTGNKGNRRRK